MKGLGLVELSVDIVDVVVLEVGLHGHNALGHVFFDRIQYLIDIVAFFLQCLPDCTQQPLASFVLALLQEIVLAGLVIFALLVE